MVTARAPRPMVPRVVPESSICTGSQRRGKIDDADQGGEQAAVSQATRMCFSVERSRRGPACDPAGQVLAASASSLRALPAAIE